MYLIGDLQIGDLQKCAARRARHGCWWNSTILAVAISCTLASSCTSPTPAVNFAPPSEHIRSSDYSRFLHKWTRENRVIKDLDTTLRVHATCFSPEFIAAYVARQGKMYRLPEEDRAQLSKKLLDSWSKYYVFSVAASTIDFSWNDFDQKSTIWRITLQNSEKDQVLPVEVTAEKELTAKHYELFPFLTTFYKIYTFYFPRTLPDGVPLIREDTKYFALQFAGPLGHTKLVWHLK